MTDYAVDFRGFRACPCLAEWLPWFEKVLLLRGVIKHNIDITQLIGGASTSAGTHSQGGAFDVWQADPTTQLVGRQMGAATWNRTAAQGFKAHTHGVLNGCPHNSPARYQIAALADGYSGLGSGGRGSEDYGPGPRDLRTWMGGIEWAKSELRTAEAERIARKDKRLGGALAESIRAMRPSLRRANHRPKVQERLEAIRGRVRDIRNRLRGN